MSPKTHRVLSIESDAGDYQKICAALSDLPVEVVNTPSGAAAIAFLAQEVPPLILLDIELPDMRGWDILERYKADQRLISSRVVVLTAQSSPVHRLIGSLQDMVVGYMTKPVEPGRLVEVVRWALDLNA